MSEKNTVELTVVNLQSHCELKGPAYSWDGRVFETVGQLEWSMNCIDENGYAYDNMHRPFAIAPGDKIVMTHTKDQTIHK